MLDHVLVLASYSVLTRTAACGEQAVEKLGPMLAGLSQRPGAQHLLAILPGVSVSKRRVILIELLPPTCLDSPGSP